MKPLIDGDILRYEIGFSGQLKEEDGSTHIFNFDFVGDLLHDKIDLICEEVGATQAPTIFLTGDRYLYSKHLKKEYVPNFRESMAVSKPYKGNRKQDKPFHFYNITEYMLSEFDVVIAEGLEADDLMGIEQYGRWNCHQPISIICSRDKDLRMIPGLHYSWECGKQKPIGPYEVDELGWLVWKGSKLFATGMSLFYFQLLAGDTVDNIPGVAGIGEKKAYKLLEEATTEKEMFNIVKCVYEEKYGEDWKTYMKEQANLLWIVREVDGNNPIMFHPKERGLL